MRIISSDKHVLRVDEESTVDVSAKVTEHALRAFEGLLASNQPPKVVVMEDYDKGLMTPDLIRGVLKRCEEASIPVAVDPKLRRFADYKNVTLFKPNLKELNEGLPLEATTTKSVTVISSRFLPANPSRCRGMLAKAFQVMKASAKNESVMTPAPESPRAVTVASG